MQASHLSALVSLEHAFESLSKHCNAQSLHLDGDGLGTETKNSLLETSVSNQGPNPSGAHTRNPPSTCTDILTVVIKRTVVWADWLQSHQTKACTFSEWGPPCPGPATHSVARDTPLWGTVCLEVFKHPEKAVARGCILFRGRVSRALSEGVEQLFFDHNQRVQDVLLPGGLQRLQRSLAPPGQGREDARVRAVEQGLIAREVTKTQSCDHTSGCQGVLRPRRPP